MSSTMDIWMISNLFFVCIASRRTTTTRFVLVTFTFDFKNKFAPQLHIEYSRVCRFSFSNATKPCTAYSSLIVSSPMRNQYTRDHKLHIIQPNIDSLKEMRGQMCDEMNGYGVGWWHYEIQFRVNVWLWVLVVWCVWMLMVIQHISRADTCTTYAVCGALRWKVKSKRTVSSIDVMWILELYIWPDEQRKWFQCQEIIDFSVACGCCCCCVCK